jgi:hypothetical protein
VALLLAAAWLACPRTSAAQEVPPPTVRVLLIRGIFNIFSTGMDDLGQLLRDRGYEVEVSSPGGCWGAAMRLRETYERDPAGGPIVIMGHSMGGRACLHISRYLQAYNIPVKLVIIIDANPWASVPDNVERCVNLYVTNPFGVFHGSPVQAAGTSQVLNYDVTKCQRPDWADPVNHFNIDNSEWMHQVILGEVTRVYMPWRASRAPATSVHRAPPVFGAAYPSASDQRGTGSASNGLAIPAASSHVPTSTVPAPSAGGLPTGSTFSGAPSQHQPPAIWFRL